jgi:hypothetical protein
MTATTATSRRQVIVHRWPSALGLAAAAAQLATGAGRETVAIVMCVAALCYLGAAALGRRWVSWAGIVAGSIVVVASEVIGLPWWAGVGIVAFALVMVGLLGGASRPALTAPSPCWGSADSR